VDQRKKNTNKHTVSTLYTHGSFCEQKEVMVARQKLSKSTACLISIIIMVQTWRTTVHCNIT
jgi:hypothetical protein